jgi:hypothetical protein
MGYEATTEVTAEQVFAWAQEDWDRQTGLKMRRGYCGYVKADGSAFQDAVYSHGYRVVYWRFTDGRPREVCAVEKADAAERARWGKPKAPTGPRTYGCSRMRAAQGEEP